MCGQSTKAEARPRHATPTCAATSRRGERGRCKRKRCAGGAAEVMAAAVAVVLAAGKLGGAAAPSAGELPRSASMTVSVRELVGEEQRGDASRVWSYPAYDLGERRRGGDEG